MRTADLIRRGVNRLGTTLTVLWALFLVGVIALATTGGADMDALRDPDAWGPLLAIYAPVPFVWWIILGFLPPREEQQ